MKKRTYDYVGAGGFALNMRGHGRQSSSIAYLHPFDATAGACACTPACAPKALLVDGNRVRAVDTAAEREIILSVGFSSSSFHTMANPRPFW